MESLGIKKGDEVQGCWVFENGRMYFERAKPGEIATIIRRPNGCADMKRAQEGVAKNHPSAVSVGEGSRSEGKTFPNKIL